MLLLLVLSGCGLTSDEIGRFLVANTEIVDGVQQQLQPIEKKTADLPLRHGQGDGSYAYDGSVDGPGGGDWTGSCDVTGAGTASDGGTILEYDLTLDLHAATIHGVQLDGTEAVTLQFQVQGDVVSAVDTETGTLDVTGAATGHATFDVESFGASDAPIAFQGKVNGRDVAGFSD